MKLDRKWELYQRNSTKLSWTLRIVAMWFGVFYIQSTYRYIQIFFILDILQYLYLTAFYEISAHLENKGVIIEHTTLKVLPAILCFYTKSLLILWVLI